MTTTAVMTAYHAMSKATLYTNTPRMAAAAVQIDTLSEMGSFTIYLDGRMLYAKRSA